jgi:hydroxypyruvate isomerase
MKFAANLSMMYAEWPMLERFEAAASDGFTGVEIQFPYEWPAAELAGRLRDSGLTQALINTPAGSAERKDRGLAALPGREAEFRAGLARALDYAGELGCANIHVMAGAADDTVTLSSVRDVYRENLAWAAAACRQAGVRALIEPINRRDIPGYLLNRQQDAHEILAEVGDDNLYVQMDLYHCQIVEGDVATRMAAYLPGGRVGYLQIAGVPARAEPDQGELNYAYLLDRAAALGYAGWVGCEYRPAKGTRAGLAWMAAYEGLI